MDAATFIERSSFVWHQRFRLDDGIYAPGSNDVEWLLNRAQVPADLTGKTVLDIGTSNGGVAFEAERRGASRVVAVDIYPPEWFGFAQVREFLGSMVEFVEGSVYGLSQALESERFDLVLFWGVLYHLRHPLLALDELRALTSGEVSIETHVTNANPGTHGFVQFHRGDTLAGDPSNWFVPSLSTLIDWCESSGFDVEQRASWPESNPSRALLRCRPVSGEPEYVSLSYERPLHVLGSHSLR